MFLIQFCKIITSKHAITKVKFLCLPLKQNERVLSSQALKCGEECGEESESQFKHGEIYIRFRCSGMPRSSIKMFGKPAISEILHAGQELDDALDKFAVKVVQNNETVGHLPCEYSRILWLSRGKITANACAWDGDSSLVGVQLFE